MELHLYDIERYFSENAEKINNILPESSLREAQKLRFRKNRLQFLLSSFVKFDFAHRNSEDAIENIHFSKTPKGKPFLEGIPKYHFNISHSGNFLAFISGNSDVGVDVEQKNRKLRSLDALAKRFFSESEYSFLSENPKKIQKEELFLYIWTRKEAVLKAAGFGITEIQLKSFSVLTADNNFVTLSDQKWFLKSFCLQKCIISLAVKNKFPKDLTPKLHI